jgi:FkbM family methyltransferase
MIIMKSIRKAKRRLIGHILKTYIYRHKLHCYGVIIKLPKQIDPEIAYKICLRRYEQQEVALVKKYIAHNDHVLELGASIGVVSAVISSILGGTGRLVSVEANPGLIDFTMKNAGKQAFVECAAVSYADEAEVFFSQGSNPLSNTIVERSEGAIKVPSVRLEQLIKKHDLDAPVLVCDIEGAEAQILDKGVAGLQMCKALIMELHPTLHGRPFYDDVSFLEKLTNLGFDLRERQADVVYMVRRK